MPEHKDLHENQFLANPARWSGYTDTDIELTIPSSDPTLLASWVSPSTNVVAETGNYIKDFDYTTNPGSITYVGTDDIIIECSASITMTVGANFVGGRLKWAINGLPQSEPQRFIYREISSGADAGAISVQRRFTITNGDYIDFFFGADEAATLTIKKAEWGVIAVAKIF